MMVRAGALRNRVTIQTVSESTSADAYGGRAKTWSAEFDAWAEIVPQSGREFYRAQQVVSDMTHLLRIRYRPDVTFTPDNRITFGSRIFNIVSALELDERHREWMVTCLEEVK